MAHLEQSRQAWEEYAEAYDSALTPTTSRAAEKALEAAGVRRGDRLLDVAAGGGALSIPAARMGAEVLAVDYSRAMVDLLRQKAQRLGLTNLTAEYMDGTALDLEDDTFDFACSQLGIMLFPDRARGLSQLTRVVRPGGRGVMVSLGPPERVRVLTIFFEALTRAVPGFETPKDSPLFSLANPDILKNEMQGAGLQDVGVTRIEIPVVVESAEDLWLMITAGAPAIAGLLRSVPDERQEEAKAELSKILAAHGGEGETAVLPMAFNVGIGVKANAQGRT